jgi:hypothetical protein
MAEQFIHKYVLEFGQPISFYGLQPEQFSVADSNTKVVGEINDYMPATSDQAVQLTKHNISFQIDKSKDAGKESTLTIYNISDETRKFLEQHQGNNPSLLLRAGYETDTEIPIIFKGEVITSSDVFQGNTRITTLQLKSGATNLKEAYTVKSYRAGTRVEDIIKYTVGDLKLPYGTLYFPRGNDVRIQTINKPVIINNPTKEFLRKFCTDNGYKFWIEDGTVNVLPDNYVIRAGEFVFDISADTNMIGSPSISDTDAAASEKQSGNRSNITVKTTLNGAYTLGAKVNITSKFHNGVYEILGITHSGTFEGSDWYSDLVLKAVDGWEVRS